MAPVVFYRPHDESPLVSFSGKIGTQQARQTHGIDAFRSDHLARQDTRAHSELMKVLDQQNINICHGCFNCYKA